MHSRRPIVKVDMDLENNSLQLIQAIPKKLKKKKNVVDRSILRRSLSQSAKNLTNKAMQIREDPFLSPKPDKFKFCSVFKVIELKIWKIIVWECKFKKINWFNNIYLK